MNERSNRMVSNDCVVCYLRDGRICGWQMGRKGMRGEQA